MSRAPRVPIINESNIHTQNSKLVVTHFPFVQTGLTAASRNSDLELSPQTQPASPDFKIMGKFFDTEWAGSADRG